MNSHTSEKPQRSWLTSLCLGAVVEAAIVALLNAPFMGGADNPLPWVLGIVLQFPSSIGFLFVFDAVDGNDILINFALAAVVMIQTVLFAVFLRRR